MVRRQPACSDHVCRNCDRHDDRCDALRRKQGKASDLIPGIGSVTAYALTEDMGGKMTAVDKFTPLMLGIAAIGIILAFLTRNRDE